MKELITKMVKEQLKANNLIEGLSSPRGLKLLRVQGHPCKEKIVMTAYGTMMRLQAVFAYTSDMYANNRVAYDVNVYENGDIAVYFDGTFYEED